MDAINAEALRHEFKLVEYREAAAAYWKGVDIGVTYIKIFFVINGILLTVLGVRGAAAEAVQAAGGGGAPSMLKDLDFSTKAPWVGLLFSCLLAGIVPFYSRQLKNCQRRCFEIEQIYGGQLFAAIGDTSDDRSRWITVMRGIYVIALIPGLFWAYILLAVHARGWVRELLIF